jgi:hypothetical protein
MRKTKSFQGSFNELLGTLVAQLGFCLDLLRKGVQAFSSIAFFLNHFSPCRGRPITYDNEFSEI